MQPVVANVHIEDAVLPQMSSHRHLGLVLNESLSWSSHVDAVVLKASQQLGLLFRLRSQLPRLVLRDLYTIGIRPVLEYALVVWAGLSKSDHCRLERVNRRAAQLVTGITRSGAVPHKILLSHAGLPELHV